MWSLLSLKPKLIAGGLIMALLGLLYGTHKVIVYRAVGKAVAQTEATLHGQYTKRLLDASELAREREQVMVSSADKIRKEKDAKIASLNARLTTALDGLRNRPERPASDSAWTLPACPCQGASGADLSRSDGVFLAREAARADRLREALSQCYRQYDSVRESLK